MPDSPRLPRQSGPHLCDRFIEVSGDQWAGTYCKLRANHPGDCSPLYADEVGGDERLLMQRDVARANFRRLDERVAAHLAPIPEDLDDGPGRELVNLLTPLVRRADEKHEAEGGGTRHWVRDYFLPELRAAGLTVCADNTRPPISDDQRDQEGGSGDAL